jgi:dolichyl-phosphate beta-glucosyltransferase
MMKETLEYLEGKSYSYEVIIIDDGSRDSTTKVATTYSVKYSSDKIRVLTLAKNRGKGGAVQLGMLSARGEYLLMVDADGATRFSDLEKVFAVMDKIASDCDTPAIAVGSRAHLETDSIANRSFFRTVLMKGFHLIVWLLCVRSVHDSQ